MELNNLKPAKGSTHHDKRIGRGAGSGHGGTATRGHKGCLLYTSIQPAPQGRAHRIRKRSNHVTIVVDKMVTVENK